jgi:hypothetical protein
MPDFLEHGLKTQETTIVICYTHLFIEILYMSSSRSQMADKTN